MITWFIKELKLPHSEVVKIINLHIGHGNKYSALNIKQMMLGRQEWPENMWEALRYVCTHQISYVQKQIEIINEANVSEYKIKASNFKSPFGRLNALMACILLAENTPIVVE